MANCLIDIMIEWIYECMNARMIFLSSISSLLSILIIVPSS